MYRRWQHARTTVHTTLSLPHNTSLYCGHNGLPLSVRIIEASIFRRLPGRCGNAYPCCWVLTKARSWALPWCTLARKAMWTMKNYELCKLELCEPMLTVVGVNKTFLYRSRTTHGVRWYGMKSTQDVRNHYVLLVRYVNFLLTATVYSRHQ